MKEEFHINIIPYTSDNNSIKIHKPKNLHSPGFVLCMSPSRLVVAKVRNATMIVTT